MQRKSRDSFHKSSITADPEAEYIYTKDIMISVNTLSTTISGQ